MEDNKFKEKPYLHNYKLLDKLPDFINNIKNIQSNYQYTVVIEPRSFNILDRRGIENLVFANGILLGYKEITNYYEKYNQFPNILIITDHLLLNSECKLLKFLDDYEQLIKEELENRNFFKKDVDRYKYRRDFAKSINISNYAGLDLYIYSLLPDRFATRTNCLMELNSIDISDLLLQMTDYTNRRIGLSNTFFSPSIKSEELFDFLIQDNLKDDEWLRFEWNYEKEKSIVYLKVYENRISIIRLYPTRGNTKLSPVISTSLIPELNFDVIEKIYDVLNKYNCPKICKILKEDNKKLQHIKGQMVNYLISIIDLIDFASPKMIKSYYVDVYKIARNFSLSKKIEEEIFSIFTSKEIRDEIKKIISSPSKKLVKEKDFDINEINSTIKKYFYSVDIKGVEHMLDCIRRQVPISIDIYQTHHIKDEYGYDGMAKFPNFKNILDIVSFITLMDSCVFDLNFYFDIDKLIAVCQTTHLASFYVPEQISIFLPALAFIENRCTRVGLRPSEAVIKFFEDYCLRFDENLTKEEIQSIKKDIEYLWENKSIFEDYIETLHEIGQNCGCWSFVNLFYQSDELRRDYQEKLFDKAKQFLLLDKAKYKNLTIYK